MVAVILSRGYFKPLKTGIDNMTGSTKYGLTPYGLTKYVLTKYGLTNYCITKVWFMLFCWSLLPACSSERQSPVEMAKRSDGLRLASLDLAFDKQCTPHHCQSYQLTLTSNRLVKIAGLSDKQNQLSKQLSDKDTKRISQLIHQLKLQSMQTSIVPGQSECTNYASDADSYRLAVKKGHFSQTLQIYEGCPNLAQRYRDLIDWFEQQVLSLDRPEF